MRSRITRTAFLCLLVGLVAGLSIVNTACRHWPDGDIVGLWDVMVSDFDSTTLTEWRFRDDGTLRVETHCPFGGEDVINLEYTTDGTKVEVHDTDFLSLSCWGDWNLLIDADINLHFEDEDTIVGRMVLSEQAQDQDGPWSETSFKRLHGTRVSR
jgi:hypothetical protein